MPIGLLLSTGAVSLFSHMTGDSFETWGWRIPFLLSIVLIGLGLWIRLGVLESPLFAREVENNSVEKQPVLEVIKRNPKEILLSALLRMSEQMPFYIFTVFVLEYGTDTLGLRQDLPDQLGRARRRAVAVLVPFFGHLSDRIGRKRMYMTGAALTFSWASRTSRCSTRRPASWSSLAIVFSLIPHDMQYGPQAALIAETFPTRLRYSGAGLGYQLASVVAGGPAPLIATWLLHTFNSSLPIGSTSWPAAW